jgi:RND family efflux transporter MFP subunit
MDYVRKFIKNAIVKNKSARRLRQAGLAALLVLPLYVTCANLKKDAEDSPAKKVKGTRVEAKELPNLIDGFGTLSYQKKVDLASNQDGALSKLTQREGERVEKGGIVALLENPQIVLAVERAENALAQAEAALALARSQLFETELQAEANLLSLEKSDAEMTEAWKAYYEEKRKQISQETIYEAGGLSDEAIHTARFQLEAQRAALELAEKELEIKRIGFRDKDLIAAGIAAPDNAEEKTKAFVELLTTKARAELSAAQASRDAAEKELTSAQLAKNDLVIRSPINGIVAARFLEEGERVKREDKVVSIMDTEYLYAVFPVRESDSFKLAKGMDATVELDGTASSYNGVIDLVSPYADSKSFTFSIRVLISKQDLKEQNSEASDQADFPKPGMFARVSVNLGNPRPVLALKDSAIINKRNGEGSVFVINGNLVNERKITLGDSIGDEWEIVSGLKAGEIAVVQPDSGLQEGAYVSLVE